MSLITENASLTGRNTFRLSSTARYLALPSSLHELETALEWARNRSLQVHVLGQGSNVILASFIDALVIIPQGQHCQWEAVDGSLHDWDDPAVEALSSNAFSSSACSSLLLHVDAGVNWPSLVVRAAQQGLWGIENLALIPGNAGAAPVQNIGAYGVELSDVLEAVHCIDIASGDHQVLSAEACELGYRSSIFKGAFSGQKIITKLVVRLSTVPAPRLGYADLEERVKDTTDPYAIVEAVSEIRRSKLPDPKTLANAGSFFKNPVIDEERFQQIEKSHPNIPHYPAPDGIKLAAGWLIDQCGLKGYRSGHFGIHERQALVVVHFGGGTVEELLEFSDFIVQSVEARFGVRLEREPRTIT